MKNTSPFVTDKAHFEMDYPVSWKLERDPLAISAFASGKSPRCSSPDFDWLGSGSDLVAAYSATADYAPNLMMALREPLRIADFGFVALIRLTCAFRGRGAVITSLGILARPSGGRVEELARVSILTADFTLPEDVAAAVSFFASEDARHVTGSKLIVDGATVTCGAFMSV